MSKVFTTPSLSIEELEARQELSVIAPGDMATEAVKKEGDGRCGGDKEAPIDVTVG